MLFRSKKTVLAFAVGLHLSEDETIDLLKSAGYAFSDGSKRDWIVRYLSLIHILDEVVFFLRKGHLLPLAKDGKKIQSVADVDFADLRLLAYAPDGASYEYYTDDGETKDYDKPEHFVHITLDADGNSKSDRATVKVEG